MVWIWYLHRQFFRRFGLGDGPMVVLNALLLFVVLVYVYPLKFLATLVFGQLLDPGSNAPILSSQVSQLIVIYGIGYVAVFVVFSSSNRTSSTSAPASGAFSLHCRRAARRRRFLLFGARPGTRGAWRPKRETSPRARALGSLRRLGAARTCTRRESRVDHRAVPARVIELGHDSCDVLAAAIEDRRVLRVVAEHRDISGVDAQS